METHSPCYPVLYRQIRVTKIRIFERHSRKMNHKTLRCPVLPYLFILKKCCFWKKPSTMDANFLEASQHCQRGQQPFLCRPASDSCQCHRGWVTSKPSNGRKPGVEAHNFETFFKTLVGHQSSNHHQTCNLEAPGKHRCQAMSRFKERKKIESRVAMFHSLLALLGWFLPHKSWVPHSSMVTSFRFRSIKVIPITEDIARPPIGSVIVSPEAFGAPNGPKTGAQVSRIQTIDLAGCARHVWMVSRMRFLMTDPK